jgi:hypothetical protein
MGVDGVGADETKVACEKAIANDHCQRSALESGKVSGGGHEAAARPTLGGIRTEGTFLPISSAGRM